MSEFCLRLKGLSFSYGAKSVLRELDLEIGAGQTLALLGPNGSGKTTLFRCITGLERPTGGQILLNGVSVRTEGDFRKLRRLVGYSVQNAEDQLIFPTPLEDASFGPLNLGMTPSEARAQAMRALELLGIAELAEAQSHELSGGQQKLVALATVLAMRPKLLLLDEPFNALDAHAILRLRKVIANMECAKVIVTHDPCQLAQLCPIELILENGRLWQKRV